MTRSRTWRATGRAARATRLALAAASLLVAGRPAVAQSPSLMDRLLGLRQVSWGTDDAWVGWAHPLPAWAWVLIVAGACLLAGWSYSRLLGPRPVRLALAGLRSVVIVAVAVLLAGPTLIDPDEREEPDAVVFLVDRSGSMTIQDMAAPRGAAEGVSGGAISRDAALRAALLSQAADLGERGLSAGVREAVWLGFGGQVVELPPLLDEQAWSLPRAQPDSPATALRSAIEAALAVAPGRPLASIIVFSDGRTPQSTGADLVRRVAQRGTRIHVVPLGPTDPGLDLWLAQVDAPEQAFSRDIVPVTVGVGGRGDLAIDPAAVRVRLVDVASKQVVDDQPLAPGGLGEPVRLTALSDRVGRVRYQVEVIYDPPPGQATERVTSNNTRQIEIELIDRPVRVLYVEGYPRWEYRYLKNMLIREESIDSSIVLLSADQAFAQEGDSPITRPPATSSEIEPYDVIIIGDVPPNYFTSQQLTLMRDHVATSGAGLLWIGGARSTPMAYAGSPLEDLLPMRAPQAVRPIGSAATAQVQPTPLAEALSVLQLRGAESAGGSASDSAGPGDWPDELAPLRWVQDPGPLKPSAEVLATSPTVPTASGRPLPLLMRLRYGAGQSLYLGTDETWRWRYGRGELYFEQFWVQLVRMLGRHRVQQTIDRARLTVSHRQVDVGAPVVVELIVEDAALLERELSRIEVSVARLGVGPSDRPVTVDRIQLLPRESEASERRRTYQALWRPTVAGSLMLRVTEPALDALNLARGLEAVAPDDEMRQVAPDHAKLAALAQATGGRVVPLDALHELLPATPNLAEKTAIDTRESLWNSWLALAAVLGLLTAEWIARKVIQLV